MSRLLVMSEVSERLNKSAETLKRWRKNGVGPPSFLVGGTVRYDEDDLNTWIAQRRAATISGDVQETAVPR